MHKRKIAAKCSVNAPSDEVAANSSETNSGEIPLLHDFFGSQIIRDVTQINF